MKLSHLILREISHRKLSVVIAILAVSIAAASVVSTQALLSADQIATRSILNARQSEVEAAIEEKETAVQQAGAELQDFVRKQMKGLGFNILILPQDQELSELHLNGSLSATMPEDYVTKLAESEIVTINHLLPSVTKRIEWEERDIEIVLQGTRGEVPILHRGLKKPLLDAVAPGQMVVGHTVHTQLGLAQGDEVELLGNKFTVSKLHPERGSSDDVTVWIDLRTAQELLGLQNLVHAILALECECAGDRISQIRAEIQNILPGTQVVERYSRALARAETRAKAKQTAEAALVREQEAGQQLLDNEAKNRRSLEAQHARSAEIAVPIILVTCGVIVGTLAFLNARQRRHEIGLWRALGLRTSQLTTLFLGKSVLIGAIGGACGVILGIGIASAVLTQTTGVAANTLLREQSVLMSLFVAPVMTTILSAAASWIAATFAARQEAAIVLKGE